MARRHLVFIMPGDPELALLSRLLARDDLVVLGVVEPRGTTATAALAEVAGLRVVPILDDLAPPPGTLVVVPDAWRDDPAVRFLAAAGLVPTTAKVFPTPVVTTSSIERETEESAARTSPSTGTADDPRSAAEALLGRLLEAGGGSSASLMSRCPVTGVLLVAAAVGVADDVVRRACLPPGEGLAGRALALGSTLRITGPHPGGRNDDRLVEALCHPLFADGEPVGVVNVARHEGDPPWRADPLVLLQEATPSLAARLRDLVAVRAPAPAVLDRMREELRELRRESRQPTECLAAWGALLALHTGCHAVGFALRSGERIIVAEGDQEGNVRALALPSDAPGWAAALEGASCQYVAGGDGSVRLFVPLAAGPGTVATAWLLDDAASAHAFRLGAAPLLRLLADQLDALLCAGRAITSLQPEEAADTRPDTGIPVTETKTAVAGAEILGPDAFAARLEREVQRCRRYHTGCAVYAVSAIGDPGAVLPRIAAALRSSDAVSAWPDGQLLVLTPEDGQEARRTTRRLGELCREIAGLTQPAPVRRVVYPGPHADAAAMLRHLLGG